MPSSSSSSGSSPNALSETIPSSAPVHGSRVSCSAEAPPTISSSTDIAEIGRDLIIIHWKPAELAAIECTVENPNKWSSRVQCGLPRLGLVSSAAAYISCKKRRLLTVLSRDHDRHQPTGCEFRIVVIDGRMEIGLTPHSSGTWVD